jgi:hypothetical protein
MSREKQQTCGGREVHKQVLSPHKQHLIKLPSPLEDEEEDELFREVCAAADAHRMSVREYCRKGLRLALLYQEFQNNPDVEIILRYPDGREQRLVFIM